MLPKLIQVGQFTLYSFGTLVILGFIAGVFLASVLVKRRGLPGDAFQDGAVVILLASILGARLVFVAINWREYSGSLFDVLQIWRGGMSFHGGAAAGIISGLLYMRFRGLPVLAMADAAGPGLALGYAVGRIGCLLNGCCYGGPTDLPWGIAFPDALPGVAHYHPAQIYASVINLALCAGLVVAYLRPHRNGQVLALFVGGYSIYRFAIEIIRHGVTAKEMAFGLTEAQVFSLAALVAAAGWWLWLQKRGTPAPELVSQAREEPAPGPAPATARD